MLRAKLAMLAAGSAAVLALGGLAATPASAATDGAQLVPTRIGDFLDSGGSDVGDVLSEQTCTSTPATANRIALDAGQSAIVYANLVTCLLDVGGSTRTGTSNIVGGVNVYSTS
ncbi:hypothetical protein [Streptomyces sp. NPDC013455]|uniref:hypothetical protein n=1 Tax=Streptomyces sp. NPDC013455 TaxID=3155605 RepID=UPI00340243B9